MNSTPEINWGDAPVVYLPSNITHAAHLSREDKRVLTEIGLPRNVHDSLFFDTLEDGLLSYADAIQLDYHGHPDFDRFRFVLERGCPLEFQNLHVMGYTKTFSFLCISEELVWPAPDFLALPAFW
jgi:hypothetical protein